MLTFLGGVFYGIIAVVVFALFIVLTLMTYAEHVENFVEDEDMDGIVAFCEVIERLGVARFLIALAIAFLWPVSITLYLIFTFAFKGKYLDELPVWARNLLLWVFLGFGKFKTETREQAAA
jgi:amino acid transporter